MAAPSSITGTNVFSLQPAVVGTLAYRQAVINDQLQACDELLTLCANLDRLQSEAAEAGSQLKKAEQRAQQDWAKQTDQAEKNRRDAKKALAGAVDTLEKAQSARQACQTRSESLAVGQFPEADAKRIAKAARLAHGPHDDALKELAKEHNAAQQRLDDFIAQIQQRKAELESVTTSMALFAKGDIPPHVKPAIDQATARSRAENAAQAAAAKKKIDEFIAAQKVSDRELAAANRRIEQAQTNARELKETQSGGLWKRLGSSAWWGALVTDYAKEAQSAGAQKAALNRKLATLAESITEATSAHDAIVSAKEATIAVAVAAERDRQYAECKRRKDQLPEEVTRAEESAAAERGKIDDIEKRRSAIAAARQAAEEAATDQMRTAILGEAAAELRDTHVAVSKAEADVAALNERMRAVETALEGLPQQQAAFIDSQLADHRAHESAAVSALKALRDTTVKYVADHGLRLSPPFSRTEVERTRDALAAQLREAMGAVTPEGITPSGGQLHRRTRMATDPLTDDQTATVGTASGNLYLDFDRNADDNSDQRGRMFTGLRGQLAELRRRHFGAIFPDMPPGANLLSLFQEAFFPNGMTQTYVICNLSLQENQPYLAIRPKVIGPRLEPLMPRGMTLAVCARLWDSQRDANNPVLLVQRVVNLSHSDIRPFEREVTAFVFHESNVVYPGYQRRQNVMTTEFVSSLPAISVLTRDRLQDWRAYLDWKERLIQANLVGLRYVQLDIGADGRYRFLVVAESKDVFERVRRVFRNDELRAFGLGYSQDPWDFQFNENHRGRDVELGDFVGFEELSALPDVDTEGIPWDRPFCAYVYFRLSDDAQNEYDAMIEGGGGVEETGAHFRGLVHPSGFLALSVVGDMSLVRRQRRELELLQQQSGYAPLLSSYLFDIKSANEPARLTEITGDQWFRSDLNEDQKLAVRKMISTPDLAMVQGPPGTGKTTMIAEAIWQFARQGKRVLLVSQATLAVENALERLAHAPAIRAILMESRHKTNDRRKRGDHSSSPFLNDTALMTYYASIAKRCRESTVDVWNEGDRRRSALTKWLADADLLAHDIGTQRQQETSIASDIAAVETEVTARRAEAEQLRNVERARADVTSFMDFLTQEREWSGQLPDEVLRVYFDAAVRPIDDLAHVGIRVNRVWPEYDYGQLADKARFAAEILREWRGVLLTLPQIRGDLARLQLADSETVLAPDDAIRLGELNRTLQAAQQAMVDDASKLAEWQAIQKQIRDIKRLGSGLDRNLYERVFNGSDGDRHAHLAFTDPNAARIQVVALLERAVTAILAAQEQVTSGLDRCREAVGEYLKGLSMPQQDAALIPRLDGRLRELSHKAGELTSQRRDKEARLVQLMSERIEQQPSSHTLSVDAFPQVRSAVAQGIQSIQTQLDGTRAFREAWQPILQKWTSDLTRAETVRADQATFLPTYISSCNVIGVTCTENRRTLEDAGHTRFDVVIVDEVSKATPPEIIMPLLMGRTAILVGDHRQLPPLFKEREGSWEEVVAAQEENGQPGEATDSSSELTAENFERFRKMVTSSLFKEHFENAPDSLKSFLFTQYRMHPQIMRVVNQFYENRLVCGLTDPDAKQDGSDPREHRVHGMTLVGVKNQQYLKPDQHVLWIDSTTDPQRQKHFERRDGASSKANDLEAILIAKCLCDIEEACRAQGYGRGGKKPKQVGVITFYGRQVRAIREAVKRLQRLRNCDFSAIRYDVNTVDRYQGQERPIIIVSMVRNPPWKLSARANTAQFERINVALSRAQELLIVTGAKDVFCSYPVDLPYLDRPGRRKVEVYRHIIGEIDRGGGFWNSDVIIDAQEFLRLLPREQAGRTQPNQRRGRR